MEQSFVLNLSAFPGVLDYKKYTVLTLYDGMYGTFLGTFAAAGTFLVIDVGHIFLHGNGTRFTLFFAELTSETAGAAHLFHCGAPVFVGALHRMDGGDRKKFNQVFGTGRGTFSAGLALCPVYAGHTVYHMDGIEGAGNCAAAKAQTAIIAFPGRKSAGCGRGTVFDPHIITFHNGVVAVTRTFYESNFFYAFFRFHSHDVGDLFSHCVAAHRTAVYGGIACHDSSGQGITPCIAASAAVVAGKEFPDGSFPGIGFYFEFISHDYQKNSDQEADNGNRYGCNNN